MLVRVCILFLLFATTTSAAFARDAEPNTRSPKRVYADSLRNLRTPQRFTPDSARISNPEARERNERLYDSIR